MKKRIAKLLTLVVVCSLSFTVVEADTGHAVNEVMEDASVTIDEIVLDKAPGIMEAARVSGEYSNLDNSGTYYLGNSIPVFTPKPKYLAYLANVSISILVPIV